MKNGLLFDLENESVWTHLKTTTEPIIVFGTGNGADKVFRAFSRYSVTVSGVAASNGFVRDRYFHGFKVEPLSHFEELYESFTVAVAFGSSLKSVMDLIKEIGEKHALFVPCVPVVGEEIFDDEFVEKNGEKLNRAYSLLSDGASRHVFESYVNFLYSGKLSYLFSCESEESEAFLNCIHLKNDEIYADIGAYRGDTVERFLKYTGGEYQYIIAAEPDKKSFLKLIKNCGGLERFYAKNAVVTSRDGEIPFSQSGGRQSFAGCGELMCGVTLETLMDGKKPSYIKIDAEGEELNILNGSKEFLNRCKPKMNIAAYHKNSDIFDIPILLKEICPEYKIYLRHFPYIPAWDTLYFCETE